VKVRLTRNFVQRQPAMRLEGYWQGDVLVVDRSQWIAHRPPVASSSWPRWATELAAHARPGDRGLGDVVEREIGPFGSDAFKEWYAGVAGVMARTCRCAEWKPVWNARYPATAVV